jgi:hypothetical protein
MSSLPQAMEPIASNRDYRCEPMKLLDLQPRWFDVPGIGTNKDGVLWQRTGDDFEDLTLTPSIDASNSGHWHGFITGGQIQ